MSWLCFKKLYTVLINNIQKTKETSSDTKITDILGKIPIITGLVTTAALAAVEKKIQNVSDLVKKTKYDAKVSEIYIKYFNRSDYDNFTTDILNTKIKQKELVDESDISRFKYKFDLEKKIRTLGAKADSTAVKTRNV